MRYAPIIAAAAASFTYSTYAASIPPRDTTSSLWIPQDLYASGDPQYAGEKIILSNSDLSSAIPVPPMRQYAMTYTPYTSQGECKTPLEIISDMSIIASKGFRAVRLYATDCAAPQTISMIAAEAHLRLILGIYISDTGTHGQEVHDQVEELAAWGIQHRNWDLVDLVLVGNEALFNGFVTPQDLADLIMDVKVRFKGLGYTGKVTTAEPLGTLQEHREEICEVLDMVAANLHPFFHADVSAYGAGDFVAMQLEVMGGVCGEKRNLDVLALEIGWPSYGEANFAAVPGWDEQKIAIEGVARRAGDKVTFASFVNEDWREDGGWGVEKHWGCGHVFKVLGIQR